MALTNSELQKIRAELGYHGLAVNAEPYVSYYALFDQIIKPYLLSGAITSSATVVAASSAATPATLTLQSTAGFALGNVAIVDVDNRQERATIVAMNATTITVQLSRDHGPSTYPVVCEGAESIAREILDQLRAVADTIRAVKSRVGLSRVDDVEFFGGGSSVGSKGVDPLTNLLRLQGMWRDELASCLGVERLNGSSHGGGSSFSMV